MQKNTKTDKFLTKQNIKFIKRDDDDESNQISFTHTSFPPGPGETRRPASYYIPQDKLKEFHQQYIEDCFNKGNHFYITEKQIDDEECFGPILVDLDFRYGEKIETKQHTEEDIKSIIDVFLNSLKEFFIFKENEKFNVYIFEKPHINRENKNGNVIVKDGIHILIDIQSHRNIINELRNEVLKKINIVLDKLPLINIQNDDTYYKYHDVVDDSIMRSHKPNNWCFYGSRKPGNEAYQMIYHYSITYNENEKKQFCLLEEDDISEYSNNVEKFQKISAQYKNNLILEKTQKGISICEKQITKPRRVNVSENNIRTMTRSEFLDYQNIVNVTSIDELNEIVKKQMECDLTNSTDLKMKEAHDYTMILPEIYSDEQGKWIRVGWALKNTDIRLFGTWMLFSAKSTKFSICDISEYRDMWEEFKVGEGCKTSRSIIRWAKSYYQTKSPNENEYLKLYNTTIDHYVEKALAPIRGPTKSKDDKEKDPYGTDWDMGCILHCMYKDKYICASRNNNNSVWYVYINNHWKLASAEAELLLHLSTKIHDIFQEKMVKTVNAMYQIERESDIYSNLEKKIGRICKICSKLKDGSKKRAILSEASLLFLDSTFYDNADKNDYLLCFNNGVYDFKEKNFRPGYPDDYLTMSTNINYIPYNKAIVKHKDDCENLRNFVKQIYPDEELHDFIWELFASLLIGGNKMSHFYMFIGCGSNGKSLMLRLIELMMGDYYGELSCDVLISKEVKPGKASPEIMDLRGRRVTVTSEISSNAVLNEATMKRFTGGTDKISGRPLYGKDMISFIPQFVPIVLTNVPFEVNDKTEGSWRRIKQVDHEAYFTENPVDNDLKKPYQFKKNYTLEDDHFHKWVPIFMSMLVEIAKKKQGIVKKCAKVDTSSENYRIQQDKLSQFINEKIMVCQGESILKRDLASEFDNWMLDNYGKKMSKKTELHKLMDEKFGKFNKKWKNVTIITDDDDDVDDLESSSNLKVVVVENNK